MWLRRSLGGDASTRATRQPDDKTGPKKQPFHRAGEGAGERTGPRLPEHAGEGGEADVGAIVGVGQDVQARPDQVAAQVADEDARDTAAGSAQKRGSDPGRAARRR